MLSVSVHYADLELSVRKGLASRHALLTLKADGRVAKDPGAERFSRKVDGALLELKVPIYSPDTDRLDAFVTGQVRAALSVLSTPLPTLGVCCTTCTGGASAACNGSSDAQYVEPAGACIRPLKECCDLAIRTMQRLYASLTEAVIARAEVRFALASKCPDDAVHCVSGSSAYGDGSTEQLTKVTLDVGLVHWDLDSYAALTLILAHELVCHVGHGLRLADPRKNASAQDRYVEGWMDFVARKAVLEELKRSWRQLSKESPLKTAQMDSVAGTMAGWRTKDAWSGAGACEPKRDDSAAPHRRYGETQAREALAIFDQLGASPAFFDLSAKFNAAVTTKVERDALLEEVDVASGMIGGHSHPLTPALERFTITGDIEKFRQDLAAMRRG